MAAQSTDWMYPRIAVWELTFTCNMECRHCGSIAGGGRKRADELTPEEALKVADQLGAMGTERITLSGGELFLRRDWDAIAARLQSYGIQVGLLTNGFLLERHLERITALPKPVAGVGISLDGTRQTHNFIRGVAKSYDRALDGFRQLNEAGVRTGCVTSVSRRNIDELDEMYEVLVEAGVGSWQVQLIIAEGRMRGNPDVPEPEDVERVARFIVDKKRDGRMYVTPGDNIGFFTDLEEPLRDGEQWTGCYAGLLVVGIEANGNIKGCLSQHPELMSGNPFVEGNIRERSLMAIWESPGAFAYNRQFDLRKARGFCRSCPHLRQCRCGCTATAYAVHGTKYENSYCVYQCEQLKAQNKPLPTYASGCAGACAARAHC